MPSLGGCATGEAKITGGYRLPAKHVIHTVGPVWRAAATASRPPGGVLPQLAAARRRHGLKTIAFPAISCGIYGYPVSQASAIAVRETRAFLAAYEVPARVTFVTFGDGVWDAYRALLDAGTKG